MKAIIVEDELGSVKLLENLLKEFCPQVDLIGSASTVAEAFQMIKKETPDFIFLDIEMQKETGFDLLQKFDQINFEIIFTTAYEQYALKAIKFCALDYLLKPIDVDELKAAVDKVIQRTDKQLINRKFEMLIQNMRSKNSDQFQLALPSMEGINFVKVSEILYLKSDRQYTFFYLKSGEKIMTSKNLGEYEKLLSEHNFIRAHHSSIINLNEVKKYLHSDGGYVLMSNDEQIDISKRKKDDFLKAIYKK